MSEPSFSKPAIEQASGTGQGAPERAAGTPAGFDPRGRRLPIAPHRLVVLASLWAGLAGLLSFGDGEAKLLEASAKHERFIAGGRTIDWSTPATKEAAARVTSSRLHAVFGGLLGLFMGWLGGWTCRSRRAAFVAGCGSSGGGCASTPG